jgi:hypothetical protein
MGGLLVATVLTLILLPVLYVTIYDRKPRDDTGKSDVEKVVLEGSA